MEIPDDYVQFFVEDAAATDGAYTLGTDAVIPVGVASIAWRAILRRLLREPLHHEPAVVACKPSGGFILC